MDTRVLAVAGLVGLVGVLVSAAATEGCVMSVNVHEQGRNTLEQHMRYVTDQTSAVTGIRFEYTQEPGADLDVVWGEVENTHLAEAGSGRITINEQHVDQERFDYGQSKLPTWVNPAQQLRIRTLLRHELGHVLGLKHSKDLTSIMYPKPEAYIGPEGWDQASEEELAQLWAACRA